ncbi:MAG: right-handed parallel beta-helix repeat-containing protein [Anaerolinea sp.]|nr:right-handed parallel beta-helix repeat-containing protein [Anaerolinea sp.]
MKPILLTLFLLLFFVSAAGAQQSDDLRYYDIGSPTLTDVYVDPVNGDDANTGDSSETALRTITEAWQRIPMGVELATGYHFHVAAGRYSADMLPNYWESRYGTFEHPILFSGAGAETTQIATVNLFDARYVYFMDMRIAEGIDAFHCERCDHVLLRGMTFVGADPDTYQTQETVKFNQSTHIYIEDSDISGAWDNALDFVAVQHGHVIGSTIHNAGDWCAYAKGGSAYITYERNEFYDCGTGGFSAGQGTGFQYMVPPFLTYEAYYIRFVNNVVHDTDGAGAGVQGGYNVLIAHNTFTRIGARSHMFEAVFGGRSCDGGADDPSRVLCTEYAAAGGWGNDLIGDGENFVRIPNRHVFVYNNVFYNPDGYQSQWSHFTIFAPFGAPVPVLADDDLQIVGNVIWNGGADHPLGLGDGAGCAADNPTCNEMQLLRDNAINTLRPDAATFAVAGYAPVPLPAFVADDLTVPPPDQLETVSSRDGAGADVR